MNVNELINFVVERKFFSLYRCEKAIDEDKMNVSFVTKKLDNYAMSGCISLTDIYRCEDGFAGITGIIPDDGYTDEDINETCIAEQYVAIPSVDYVPKSAIDSLTLKPIL